MGRAEAARTTILSSPGRELRFAFPRVARGGGTRLDGGTVSRDEAGLCGVKKSSDEFGVLGGGVGQARTMVWRRSAEVMIPTAGPSAA